MSGTAVVKKNAACESITASAILIFSRASASNPYDTLRCKMRKHEVMYMLWQCHEAGKHSPVGLQWFRVQVTTPERLATPCLLYPILDQSICCASICCSVHELSWVLLLPVPRMSLGRLIPISQYARPFNSSLHDLSWCPNRSGLFRGHGTPGVEGAVMYVRGVHDTDTFDQARVDLAVTGFVF